MVAGEVDWEVYYYGMVTGVATRDEFDGITGTSEDGGSEPLVRAYFAVGAAFGVARRDRELARQILMAHRRVTDPRKRRRRSCRKKWRTWCAAVR